MRKGGPGKLRIVAGTERGRLIKIPLRAEVRPTTEMVREAVFDVLGPVEGLRALDLFAGTGAMGLEALSRGAAACVFVELDPQVLTVLRGNIASLGYEGVSEVLGAPYGKAAGTLKGRGDRFDLLFVDPPYRMLAEVETALTPVVPGLLGPGGIMVIEGPTPSVVTFGGETVFERDYGDTRVTMVRAKERP